MWLLMGGRAGDNNQLLALAEALKLPFEAKRLRHNGRRRFLRGRASISSLNRSSRALIHGPWPQLVIAVGYANVPVARYVRRRAGGGTKLVHVGNPRARLDDFDLQITTPQYTREPASNLLELPFPIGNPAQSGEPTREEQLWLRGLPRPRRLVAVGGPARHWQIDHTRLERAIRILRRKASEGSIVVATSSRTPPATRRRLQGFVQGPREVVVDEFPTFATLLRECDEIHVTADSVSMLSEGVLAGKPVGMIPIRRSVPGIVSHWLWERPTRRATIPDLRNFWRMLFRRGLVGTVELPVASQVCDTVDRAARAVRSLLAPGVQVDKTKSWSAAARLGTPRRSRRRQ